MWFLHHAGVVHVNATFIWQAKKRKSKPKDAKKKRSSAASKKKAKSGKSGKDGKKSKKQKESKSSSSESEEPETEEQKKKREAKEQEDARKKAEKEAAAEKKRLEKEEEKKRMTSSREITEREHRHELACWSELGKKSIRSFLQNSVMIDTDVRNTIDAVVRYDLKLTYLYIRCIDQIKISDVRARCVCCAISWCVNRR